METNVERRRRKKLAMTALLRDTDVMADVLGFLTRRKIALRLARVNRRFSALCNCWCQPEEETDDSGSFKNGQQRKRKRRNQVSKSKK